MQPRTDIMKLGLKPHAVAQFSKINCRDISSCENIPDVFRGWLAEMEKILLVCCVGFWSVFLLFVFLKKKKGKMTVLLLTF